MWAFWWCSCYYWYMYSILQIVIALSPLCLSGLKFVSGFEVDFEIVDLHSLLLPLNFPSSQSLSLLVFQRRTVWMLCWKSLREKEILLQSGTRRRVLPVFGGKTSVSAVLQVGYTTWDCEIKEAILWNSEIHSQKLYYYYILKYVQKHDLHAQNECVQVSPHKHVLLSFIHFPKRKVI